jgi:O-antigen/teichoic acid export membrane protein
VQLGTQKHTNGYEARVAWNAALNVGGRVLPMLFGFLVMPFIVRSLGASRFGILTLAWTILTYFGLFDFGIGRSVTKWVSRTIAAGETDRIPNIVHTALLIQGSLGLISGALLTILNSTILAKWIHVPPDLYGESYKMFYVIALAAPLLLCSSTLSGILEAYQKFGILNVITIPISTLTIVCQAVSIRYTSHLHIIATSMILVQVIRLVVLWLVCQHIVPGLKRYRLPQRKTAYELLAYGSWIALSNLLGVLIVYADRFVIAAAKDVAVLAHYAAGYDLLSRLSFVPTSLVAALFPVFSFGDQNYENVSRLFGRSCKYTCLFVGMPLVVIATYSYDILSWYLGKDWAVVSALPVRILAIGFLANFLAYIPFSYIQAIGKPHIPAKYYVIELLCIAWPMWFLVHRYGASGAAIAWACRSIFDAYLLFRAVNRELPMVAALTSGKAHRALIIVAMLLFCLISVNAAFTSGFHRIVFGCLSVLLCVAVAWIYACSAGERMEIKRRARSFVSSVYGAQTVCG